jgi:hypothetical protein
MQRAIRSPREHRAVAREDARAASRDPASWVYYMKQIKPDSVVIDEQNSKILFAGDNTIVEHTFEGLPKVDKNNKNSITLRGDPGRTKDALKLIFTKYCLPTSG